MGGWEFPVRDTVKWDGTIWAKAFVGDGSGLTGILTTVTWADINFTGSNLTDIVTKSHTVLSDIGTNTHAQIDTHIADTSDPHGSTLTQTRIDLTNANWTNWASGANIDLTGLLTLNGSAGTTGQVLTSSGASADPVWTTLTNSSNVEIIASGALTGTASAATISSISGYNHLYLMGQLTTSGTTLSTFGLKFNNSAAGYAYNQITSTTIANVSGSAALLLGLGQGNSVPVPFFISIPAYAEGTGTAYLMGTGSANGFTAQPKMLSWWYWEGSAGASDINRIDLFCTSTEYLVGNYVLVGTK